MIASIIIPSRVQTVAESRWRTFWLAIVSRSMVLILAITFDQLIPDHNPGDDVLRFDGLLLSSTSSSSSSFYRTILQPLTKWDSARFLHLALEPQRRNPDFACSSSRVNCTISEEAHAFFPLFPWLIRQLRRLLLLRIGHTVLLPDSEYALVVSAAILINTVAFISSALLLHELTLTLVNTSTTRPKAVFLAGVTASLFVFNPASIFFTVAYSESIFSFFTLAGYVLYHKGFTILSIVPWSLASATRSNGSLTAGFIFLQGLGQFLAGHYLSSVRCCITMVAITLPIIWHDQNGYDLHCSNYGECDESITSFYSYVQQKHWNVGFLHYYELKQIPNFVLAFPVLFYSCLATVDWIKASRKRQKETNVIRWAFSALRQQVSSKPSVELSVLLSPNMLGHFAVLAVAALLGLTIAHVQISTRLICSLCPAIYWYLADLVTRQRTFILLKRETVFLYCFGYILAGCILHPNFLPWT